MKEISAGIIISCPSGILMCHPTEKSDKDGNYDIPKGHVEPGEDYFEACARELKEETGLDVNDFKSEIKELGRFFYRKGKDLYLFYVRLDYDIDVSKLVCKSTFVSKISGRTLPEMDGYVLSWNSEKPFPRLANLLISIGVL